MSCLKIMHGMHAFFPAIFVSLKDQAATFTPTAISTWHSSNLFIAEYHS